VSLPTQTVNSLDRLATGCDLEESYNVNGMHTSTTPTHFFIAKRMANVYNTSSWTLYLSLAATPPGNPTITAYQSLFMKPVEPAGVSMSLPPFLSILNAHSLQPPLTNTYSNSHPTNNTSLLHLNCILNHTQ
jgi:hypothetical protein